MNRRLKFPVTRKLILAAALMMNPDKHLERVELPAPRNRMVGGYL